MKYRALFGATVTIIASICVWFFAAPAVIYAASVDELKQQIDSKNAEIQKIQEELRKYNDELSKTSQTSRTLKNTVATLNKNIVNLRRQISLNQVQIQQKQLEVQQYTISIKAKESDIADRREVIKNLVQSLAQTADIGMVQLLLQNKTLSDFFSDVEQNKNLQNGITENLAELRFVKKSLEDDRAAADESKRQLAQFQGTLTDKRQIVQAQQQEQQNLLDQTKNQEKQYQQLVTETEKKYDEVQRELEQLEAELRKQVDTSSLPIRREGFFTWPTEGVLSQGYGATAFARTSDFYTFHNGIDIAAAVGTQVVAAEAGKVVAVGNSDLFCPRGAYGKFIVIDHGNNLVTLYAHLSLQKVGVGMQVERGQLIGYMGATGHVTGPHLHFTVYDARTFELRQSKVCGILPYGGSINPMDYL